MTPLFVSILTFWAVLGVLAVFAVLYARDDEDEVTLVVGSPRWLRKEDAACCKAAALPDGRPVIGYCGPDCERRPK